MGTQKPIISNQITIEEIPPSINYVSYKSNFSDTTLATVGHEISVTIKTDEVNECMNLLNLGKSVCRTGVADKTLQIGRLIFSIVGNDRIDVLNMNNEEQIKLNKMIDELGPLIPQAVKNIIHVSKEYEARICNVPSNTTLLLERVYMDLYDKQTEVTLDFSPYIDFNSLINIDDNIRFIKTIFVLVVFSFLFMQFANIVVAFLSRGASVTKIT